MAGSFVSCFRIPPPANRALMIREGASVYWAAFSKWQNQWFMLVPGGGETKIEPPLFYWLRDCDLQSLNEESQKELAKKPIAMPVINRRGQMMLNLGRAA